MSECGAGLRSHRHSMNHHTVIFLRVESWRERSVSLLGREADIKEQEESGSLPHYTHTLQVMRHVGHFNKLHSEHARDHGAD